LPEPVLSRIRAKIDALLPTDWDGSPGLKLRTALGAISSYCQRHIKPRENLEELTELTWRRVKGEANEKLAQSLKDYAEEESRKIANRVAERTVDHQIRASRATADKLESEARISETRELLARVELVERCRQLGVIPIWNGSGHMTVVKAPDLFNWEALTANLLGGRDPDTRPVQETEPDSQSGIDSDVSL
jgi:hypothetical protein